jgi:hypothetical protein
MEPIHHPAFFLFSFFVFEKSHQNENNNNNNNNNERVICLNILFLGKKFQILKKKIEFFSLHMDSNLV